MNNYEQALKQITSAAATLAKDLGELSDDAMHETLMRQVRLIAQAIAALQPTEQPASHPVTMGGPVYAVFDGTERIAIATLKENANHVARQTAGAVVVPCQLAPISGVIAPVQPEAAQDERTRCIAWAEVHYRHADEFTAHDLGIALDAWQAAKRDVAQAPQEPEIECTCPAIDMPFGRCCKAPPERKTDQWDSARVADYNQGWNDCCALLSLSAQSSEQKG